MGSVWKRLQRVNKRAAKFQFTVSYHQVVLETTPRWQPNRLSVVWARRSRRVVSEVLPWEPTMKDPLLGNAIWPVPENKQVAVTLFRDHRTNELEDKDWIFILEDVSGNGKRRSVASTSINMKKYASVVSSQQPLNLVFKPTTKKIVSASLECTISCVFLREGKATDEDMQSMASLMSTNNNSDIAPLDDFDEEDDIEDSSGNQSFHEMLDLTAQVDKLTHSLSSSEFASTPISVSSLTSFPKDDSTPIASDSQADCGFPSNSTKTISSELAPDLSKTAKKSSSTDNGELKKVHLTLEPLQSESNGSSIQTNRTGRETTPGQDLLEWCKQVTAYYPGVRVTNLTTSWRNGLAFCAVINHFRPDLVEMDNLVPHNVRHNCKIAFDAGEILGIPRVIDPADMDVFTVPDKLAVMTYLYQLRAHFTGHELEVQQIGKTADESSYMIGRFNTDNHSNVTAQLFGQEIINLRKREKSNLGKHDMENLRSASVDSDHVESHKTPPSPQSPASVSPRSRHNSILGIRFPIGGSNENSNAESQLQSSLNSPSSAQPTLTRQSSLLGLRLPLISSSSDNADRSTELGSPSTVRDVKDKILASSKSILGKVLSPTKEKTNRKEKSKSPVSPTERPVLMTRRQLTDPFGSDDEDDVLAGGDGKNSGNSPESKPCQDRTTNVINTVMSSSSENTSKEASENEKNCTNERSSQSALTRHEELRERARQLLDQARREATSKISIVSSQDEEDRQLQLRERARKLIAEVRLGADSTSGITTPPETPSGNEKTSSTESPQRSVSTYSSRSSPNKSLHSETSRKSPSLVFTSTPLGMGRVSPDTSPLHKGNGEKVGSYIQNEMEALEREQKQIDEQAAVLEKELRAVMEAGADREHEDQLMVKWFTFVNKKNALIRRQMQLNILEKEDDLERRCELLNRELRSIIAIEEWQKTEEQKKRENLLLDELVSIVNKRDELVHHLDNQERAIDDDSRIEEDLNLRKLSQPNKNCLIQ